MGHNVNPKGKKKTIQVNPGFWFHVRPHNLKLQKFSKARLISAHACHRHQPCGFLDPAKTQLRSKSSENTIWHKSLRMKRRPPRRKLFLRHRKLWCLMVRQLSLPSGLLERILLCAFERGISLKIILTSVFSCWNPAGLGYKERSGLSEEAGI